MSTDPQQQTPKTAEFEERHSKELGVKKFAKIQAAYTFIPLLTTAVGAAAGYYLLAKPAAKLFPKATKIAAVTETAVGKAGSALKSLLNGKKLEEIVKDLNPTEKQSAELGKLLEQNLEAGKTFDKVLEIMEIKLPETPESVRLASAATVGMVGSIGGGIAVGYDKWRKDESARLAAQEINHDVANLELFKPSDAELVAENKRLSAMVAALPVIDMKSAEKHGKIEEKHHQQAQIQ